MDSDAIKVLLVDDDQGDFQMFRSMLQRTEHETFEVDWVSTYEEAMDAFNADAHDVYFLDYFLEDRTGLDLLKEARAKGIEAPIIMLTGRGGRSVDMEAMDLGASDYLVKGLVDPDALERAIRHAMERKKGARAIDEQKRRRGGRASADAGSAQAGGRTVSAANPRARGSTVSGGLGAVRWERAPAAAEDSAATGVSGSANASAPAASDPAGGPADAEANAYLTHAGDSARFWALFEATRTGVALVGLDGAILKVNRPFAETFSPTPRFTEGLSFLDLLEDSDKEAVQKEMATLAEGERSRFEAARRFLVREGHVIWAHTTSLLIRNEEGEPDHLMVLLERVEEEE